jgi:hypothetical protein
VNRNQDGLQSVDVHGLDEMMVKAGGLGVATVLLLAVNPLLAFIAFVATRRTLSAAGVWLVIVGNVGWIAASFWLLLGGVINPTVLGYALVAVQALAVAALSGLEYVGLRRGTVAAGLSYAF